MATFRLILTSDYEVWGDGSGCVENCLIDPTNEMIETAEKHGARITFFFDVCEYWAFDRIEKEGKFNGDYRPASLIREQLQKAMSNGHDVQLHFHPQWLNYKFISNQIWELDHKYWKLPEVDQFHNEQWSVTRLFEKGVQTLEELFVPLNSQYKVLAFRAGGWCIQPEKNALRAMKQCGLKIDSTVAPGRVSKARNKEYNFIGNLNKPFWEIGSNILSEGDSGVFELPIATFKLNFMKSVRYKIQKFKSKVHFLPKGCFKSAEKNNSSLLNSVKRLLEQQPSMLNFSDGTSFQEMKSITQSLMKKYAHIKDQEIPLVAISHSKTFGFSDEFDRYLDWVNDQTNIHFSTMTSFSNNLN